MRYFSVFLSGYIAFLLFNATSDVQNDSKPKANRMRERGFTSESQYATSPGNNQSHTMRRRFAGLLAASFRVTGGQWPEFGG